MSDKSGAKLGRLSLILAIGGVLVAAVILLFAELLELPDKTFYFRIATAFVLIDELCALVLGIVGRRSNQGRAGLAIAALSLLLTLAFIGYSSFETGPDSDPASGPVGSAPDTGVD